MVSQVQHDLGGKSSRILYFLHCELRVEIIPITRRKIMNFCGYELGLVSLWNEDNFTLGGGVGPNL